jgi:hypothetical protein
MKNSSLFTKKNQVYFKSAPKYLVVVLMAMLIFSACSKDDDSEQNDTYTTQVSMTDGPIDNANVSGAFVTITDVKVDGQSIKGFNATTLEVSALQNGRKAFLGNIDLESRTYSNISLVLDYENDINGNSPGCYVMTTDNVKHALVSTSKEIDITGSFDVVANAANELIIDFDLRKSIMAAQDTQDKYDFVTAAELRNSLRVANQLNTGTISGTATDSQNTSDKIVVYAYERGSFNSDVETKGQGASNVRFSNAVTSSVVSASNGSYQLSFLKEGDYELHYASYIDDNNDGTLEFSGLLQVESITSLNLLNLRVDANLKLTANVLLTAGD